MHNALNANTLNTSALSMQELEGGATLEVFGGFDAYSSDLLVSMLCKDKCDLFSPEEAVLLLDGTLADDGLEFDGPDYASGLIRLTGLARLAGHTIPVALALAHVHVEANRGTHEDLGHLLKLHMKIGAGHVHSVGVGLGLPQALAHEMARQVIALVREFQRTSEAELTVLWSFDQAEGACEDFAMRKVLHAALLQELYAPMLDDEEEAAD